MRSSLARRRPTNLTLDADLVDAARELAINVSEACERGLADEVKRARERKWLQDNLAALESSNDYVRKHGLPLEKYRQF